MADCQMQKGRRIEMVNNKLNCKRFVCKHMGVGGTCNDTGDKCKSTGCEKGKQCGNCAYRMQCTRKPK